MSLVPVCPTAWRCLHRPSLVVSLSTSTTTSMKHQHNNITSTATSVHINWHQQQPQFIPRHHAGSPVAIAIAIAMFRLPFSRASASASLSVSVSVSRAFHSSRPLAVSQGDSIPNLDVLTENSPGNKVNLAAELASGKGVIVGTPGAFSNLFSIFTLYLLSTCPSID